ncbi:hypothetical protein BP5796_07791 [Coleophoma crateriformis]|uniref:2EXR domain-containing protein n=1 Tax=Coleophoma crateriformis TaxID=565419 RepID=A0A3D8RCH9_9HELO|nr:hypothetical protein BP5796_07791 [Coleophoma crateriformis]
MTDRTNSSNGSADLTELGDHQTSSATYDRAGPIELTAPGSSTATHDHAGPIELTAPKSSTATHGQAGPIELAIPKFSTATHDQAGPIEPATTEASTSSNDQAGLSEPATPDSSTSSNDQAGPIVRATPESSTSSNGGNSYPVQLMSGPAVMYFYQLGYIDLPFPGPNNIFNYELAFQDLPTSEPSDTNNHQAELTEFPLFANFPPEICIKIWHAVAIQSRVVPVTYRKSYCEVTQIPEGSEFISNEGVPAILHVNRKARQIGLMHYQLVLPTRTAPATIYVNLAYDLIYFNKVDTQLIDGIPDNSSPLFGMLDDCDVGDCWKIPQLAIDWMLWDRELDINAHRFHHLRYLWKLFVVREIETIDLPRTTTSDSMSTRKLMDPTMPALGYDQQVVDYNEQCEANHWVTNVLTDLRWLRVDVRDAVDHLPAALAAQTMMQTNRLLANTEPMYLLPQGRYNRLMEMFMRWWTAGSRVTQ